MRGTPGQRLTSAFSLFAALADKKQPVQELGERNCVYTACVCMREKGHILVKFLLT